MGEAVLAGGGEMAGEPEGVERIGGAGGNFGRRCVAEELTEQRDQRFYERGIGVTAKTAAPVAPLAHDPGLGDAALHAMRLGSFCLGEWRQSSGTVHHQRHPFLWIVDEREFVDKSLEFVREEHQNESVDLF